VRPRGHLVGALDDRDVALGVVRADVRISCSTPLREGAREKIRGTRRRSDEPCGGAPRAATGTVSVIRSPPLRSVNPTPGRPRPVTRRRRRARAQRATRASRALISGSFSRSSEYSGAATNSVEYAATIVPTKIDSEMSVSVCAPSHSAPMNRIAPVGSAATTVVLIERISVWLTARLTDSPNVRPDFSPSRVFSRILSKTTVVSYSEYDRIVRKPMTAAGRSRTRTGRRRR
jgi:hypothetical protein